jgi:hypothetical protein
VSTEIKTLRVPKGVTQEENNNKTIKPRIRFTTHLVSIQCTLEPAQKSDRFMLLYIDAGGL